MWPIGILTKFEVDTPPIFAFAGGLCFARNTFLRGTASSSQLKVSGKCVASFMCPLMPSVRGKILFVSPTLVDFYCFLFASGEWLFPLFFRSLAMSPFFSKESFIISRDKISRITMLCWRLEASWVLTQLLMVYDLWNPSCQGDTFLWSENIFRHRYSITCHVV